MTGIRLLLGKDLRVLRRSPGLLVALVLYPMLVAVLVGVVVRYANERPRVAFVDLDDLPDTLAIGGQEFGVERLIGEVNESVELIRLGPEEARRRLETGEVVAVITVPPGFASDLRGMVESPTLVLRTTRGGISGRVEQQTQALVYNLNRRLQRAYIASNLAYIELLRRGGELSFFGTDVEVIGLEESERIIEGLEQRTNDQTILAELERLRDFVEDAQLALGQSDEALQALANPIALESDTEAGRTWLLSAQIQSYALALTLCFVCMLLAAAAIAAERDENVIGRLVRGLVGLLSLVVVKVALAALVAVALGLAVAVLFTGLAELMDIQGTEPWERLPVLVVGLALAGAAFGAFGVLVGALAREARTAVLVAFLVALPVVLLGLVPESAVGAAAWVSAAFPFAHAVDFFEAALYDLDPWGRLGREAAWLAGLGAVFMSAARLGVRRLLA
jgi:ABC-2 type transport system permease protein